MDFIYYDTIDILPDLGMKNKQSCDKVGSWWEIDAYKCVHHLVLRQSGAVQKILRAQIAFINNDDEVAVVESNGRYALPLTELRHPFPFAGSDDEPRRAFERLYYQKATQYGSLRIPQDSISDVALGGAVESEHCIDALIVVRYADALVGLDKGVEVLPRVDLRMILNRNGMDEYAAAALGIMMPPTIECTVPR